MRVHTSPSTNRLLLVAALALAAVASLTAPSRRTDAQSASPVLVSEAASTRAVALDASTRVREPFGLTSPVRFGPDARTRVMLFAMNLHLVAGEDASAVTADAEDAARKIYPLAVEYVGEVPGQEWMSSVVVRLSDQLAPDACDVLFRITYKRPSRILVRVALAHVGGGPPDDSGAIATSASPAVSATAN